MRHIPFFALGVLVGFAVAWIVRTAPEPSTEICGADETPQKRRLVLQTLGSNDIPIIRVDDALHVRTSDADRARKVLATERIFTDEDVYAWLTEVDLTASRRKEDESRRIEQQEKLKQSVESLTAVKRADVVITPATVSFYSLGVENGGATVTIQVRPVVGTVLDSKIATAIAHVATVNVSGLPLSKVVVIDATTARRIPARID